MSYIADHQGEAFGRIITQYRFDVVTGLNPMELNPTGAFATRRLEGCKSPYIIKLHRDIDDVLIDVYDFKQDDNKYKTSEVGAWIDMSGNTYFCDTWYNQNVVGNDIARAVKAQKPTIVPNQRAGWPVLRYDSVDDWMETTVNMSDFVKNTVGVMMAGYNPTGVPPTIAVPNPYLLQNIIGDKDAFMPMSRGICTPYGPNDSVFADIFYTAEIAVDMEVTAGSWFDVVWKLHNNLLYGYRNGVLIGTESVGPVGSSLNSPMIMGHNPWQGAIYLNGDVDQVYTFDKNVLEQDIVDISTFMRSG